MAKYSAATADRRTPSVLKRVFFLLLQDEGVNEDEILRDFHVDLASRGEADRRVIREASDKMRDLINATNELSVGFNLRDLQQQRWDISSANVHSEFLKVADVTFEDDQNWGRAVGLVSFAVAYAIYADSQRMHGIMPSICAWTGHVFDGKLKVFMQDSGGWEGFIEFADALRKRRDKYNRGQDPAESVWQHALTMGTAVGAIGLGALAAFTLRQAFS